jgi:hypothetical protein
MILGMEIAMFVIGIMALVRGKLKLGKNKEVTGTPARLLGLIGFVPIPLAIVLNIVAIVVLVAGGHRVDPATYGRTTPLRPLVSRRAA